MEWWKDPNWWVAVGTIGAVFVALFGDRLKRSIFPPRFTLSLKSASGNPTPVTLTAPDGTISSRPGRYYHVRVKNTGAVATNAAVYLTSVMLPGAGGWHPAWSGEVPLTWSHAELHGAFRSIGLTPVDADLLSLVKDKWIELCVLIRPNALPHDSIPPIHPGRWRAAVQMIVTVQVKATEGQSKPQLFYIAWDKVWEEGNEEITRHLSIRPISDPSDAPPRAL